MTDSVREESQQQSGPRLGLTHEYVRETASRLVDRVQSRFGEDDLTGIARQVSQVAVASEKRISRALRVGFIIRLLTWPLVLGSVLGVASWIGSLGLTIRVNDAGDLAQSLDSVTRFRISTNARARRGHLVSFEHRHESTATLTTRGSAGAKQVGSSH